MSAQGLPGVADRVAQLADLIHPRDLASTLGAFIDDTADAVVDGVLLFDRGGVRHGGATSAASPMHTWEQLPAEAWAALRSGGVAQFGLARHLFEVRTMYAGTDRAGFLVIACVCGRDDQRAARLAQALTGVVAQLLQSGFATWVTSEMHLATSESAHRALTQQNAELERAVAHLRELDQLKSNFLATVSHELRTPLTSVIGFSEMLVEGLAGPLNPEQTEYIRTILHRGEELLALITQVLEMSQLEVGAVKLRLSAQPLDVIVGRAIEVVQLAADNAGVRLIDALAAVPEVVVDAEKLQRVLQNLIGNAIKFCRSGGNVTVSAAIAPIRKPFDAETLFGEEANDALRVTVRDTGSGIEENQLQRIFEAFYQVDASSTRQHGGAGLGLSIVKNLVQAHGGDVWAQSEVGVGTAFHFTIPVVAAGP